MRSILIFLQALCLAFAPLAAQAQATDAEAMVRQVTDDVLATLRQDRGREAGGHRKAIALIEDKIAPHFDFQRMTQLAVGAGWRQASAAQREQLTRAFRTLLVRTYANSLTAYRDQTVHFKPSSAAPQDDEVTVRSEIRQRGAPPIGLDYRLENTGGAWKVFDVTVANVSLVTTYRSSFASELAQGGPDGLIRSLEQHNRRLADGEATGS